MHAYFFGSVYNMKKGNQFILLLGKNKEVEEAHKKTADMELLAKEKMVINWVYISLWASKNIAHQ